MSQSNNFEFAFFFRLATSLVFQCFALNIGFWIRILTGSQAAKCVTLLAGR